ncbi:non-ribosomal peptide synthetase [Rhodococcoides kyotonense]|uniref:non-ribosomal peptide synthetase n=1 Tax=Rhodococcoides kyotonense TaxID=398843 RepID=UPI001FE4823A|nr:non-ribosomal peptide synthetase [Rhodococcus kyotonensis]
MTNSHVVTDIDSPFPLSAAQADIYIAQAVDPLVPFTIAQYVDIVGGVDVPTLIRASHIATRELESAIVSLHERDGVVYQQVERSATYALEYRDLREADDPIDTALQYMDSRCREPVDVTGEQPVISELLHVGTDRWFWFSRAHHVVMDGIGSIVLQNRTAAVYSALIDGADVPPTRALSLREIREYEIEYQNSTRYDTDRAYWTHKLENLPERAWLAGRGEPTAGTAVTVGAVVAGSAVHVPDVLAAFAVYLGRMTDMSDIVLSVPVSGRTTARLRASAGMLAGVVPVAIDLQPKTTVGGVRRQLELELSGALRHQRFRAGHSFGPTVNIMNFGTAIRLGDVVGDYHVLSSGPVDDIMVNVYPGVAGASTRVDLLGNPDLYDQASLTTHLDRFLTILDDLGASDDDRLLDDIDLPGADSSWVPASVVPCTFPELVRGRPDDVALRFGDRSYTYRTIHDEIHSVAGRLVHAGAGPEVRVAVDVVRSDRSVIACLAVARAGASFVPVDRTDPRSVDMLRAAGVGLGITDAAAPFAGIRWVDSLSDASPVPGPVSVDNEAYLIHTSGSTGAPKGVSVTHRGVNVLADAVVSHYRIERSSRVLHLASPVFDASIQEMVMAFASGATLVVAPPEVTSGREVAEFVAAERITHLITAPAVLATLEPQDLDGVEVFDVGGDVCSPALRDRFAPGRTMFDAYGPTEATVLATVSEPMAVGAPVTIGSPLPGVRALVLDRRLRRVPDGGVGELYLGGDGIARGYDHRFGPTAAYFVADPDVPGRRLYRTGDRVRNTGTTLEFLGRADAQVQINGRRIELGEIEAALAGHRSVRDAVATVRGNGLVAFVVLDGRTAVIEAYARDVLPAWMVPTIVPVDEIPLTPSGKPDRRAMVLPDVRGTYSAPVTSTERTVAQIFSDVLSIESVGRDHNLFDAGGDSLTASTVLSRLGSPITLAELFRHPTVFSLAALVDERESMRPQSLASVVVPSRVPLSSAQHRIWVAEKLEPSTAYLMPVAVRLPAGGEVAAIAALHDVVRRHDILRSYFPTDERGPHQVVVDPARLDIRHIDADTVEQGLHDCAAQSFDLTTEVPLRTALIRTLDGDALAVVAHHIAVDGASIDLLMRDFADAWRARTRGSAPRWTRLAAQYPQFAVWNRGREGHDPIPLEPHAHLPVDGPRRSLDMSRIALRIADASAVRRLARTVDATPFMLVHTVFASTLARFGGTDRTVIGTPTSGRVHPDTAGMVGMFVETAPLVVEIDRAARFTDLLAGVRDHDLEALSHSEIPYERAVQVMLSYDTASRPDVPFEVVTGQKTASEFDLNLVLTESADSIDGWLEYASDMYLGRSVDAFVEAFHTILAAVVADPHVVVGDIKLASPGRRPRPGAAEVLPDLLRPGGLDGVAPVTADDLDVRSNRLARLMIAHGAGPETTVALSFERSAEYIVAMWAVLKTGAAFMPVDPHFPAARRAHMLRTAAVGIGGTEPGVTWVSEADALAFSDAPIADADRHTSLLPDHPVYVVHTSGSTGVPKRVTVTHRAVCALARQVVPRYGVTSASRVLQGYSVNFDAAVLETVLAFGSGATLVIAPASLVGGAETAEFLRDHGVTHFLSTPAILATVPPVETVTTVAVGGDVLPPDVVGAWAPGRTMLNAYGPTEATVVATLTGPLTTSVTIGSPLDSVACLVLDARLHPVPLGAVGELYLGGDGLARGYGDAASTAGRFVAYSGGQRVYRTGDLVRRRPDGELDFLGRTDSQVQVRGVRVELGDVEAALASHPRLDRAVADVRADRLVAWVVGDPGVDARAWAASILPSSLVPGVVVFVDHVPVTANGKVDRAALVVPDATTVDATPRTLAEDIVVGILAELLQRDDLSVDADFFAHGGDSSIAIRAAGRIGAAFGVDVPVRTLFDASTARSIAAELDTMQGRRVELPELIHRTDRTSAPSAAERRIWLQNRLNSESSAYNLACAVRLPRDVDITAVRVAIVDVLDRHEPLRTVYAPGPVVSVRAAGDVVLESFADDVAEAGFDLTTEIPVRFALVDHELVVVAHHIAVDGLSIAPLLRDVQTALDARLAGRAPEFPELGVDYADFRRWHAAVLDVVRPTQLAFWERALKDLPDYLELPTGAADPGLMVRPVEFAVDEQTSAELRALARRLGASTFVVVHAAVALLLADLASTDDVAVGTPVSGRTDSQLDDLVGMFVGTVVLRTPIRRGLTFEQFVADVRNRDLDAFAHSDVPFDDVVEHLAPSRRGDAHPFFQVLLSVSSRPTIDLDVRLLPTADTQFDLEIVIDDAGESLAGTMAFASARFDSATVEFMALRLTALLRAVVHDPAAELGRIDVLGTDGVLPAHTVGVSEHLGLADVLDAAVDQWPDEVAVVDSDAELTYRDLNARSEALKNALIARGARPGTVVALVLPRSVDHVVAVWAVAKSGAAFLPMDPAHPASRIADIIREVGPVVGISAEPLGHGIDWLAPTAQAEHAHASPPRPDDVAYVVYTSGSTGAPKGVRVTGRGIANLVLSQREMFGVDHRSTVLQFASPGFDASVFELLLAAGSGAALAIAPSAVHAGRQLAEFLTDAGVTHVCLTPAVLAATNADAVPTVTTVIMAGDAVSSELVRRWSPGRSVFDAYGPTEATIMGTCSRDLAGGAHVGIGTPTKGFDTLVLDCRLRQVPPGVVGELYLAGPALADSYVARPASTSSRFVPDPLGKPGTRMYRTGDLVRWSERPDGRVLEFLGRADAQVKIRGHRVEPAEVEAALMRHPSVDQAYVLGRESETGKELAAYVVGAVTQRDVRAFLAGRVPSYMVPVTVTTVDALPVTISGKIDAIRLPAPSQPLSTGRRPTSELETTVRRVFAEGLGLDPESVDVDADFFEIGGHSLGAVQVSDALADALHVPVPVSWMFLDRSVTALADRIERSSNMLQQNMFDVILPLAAGRDGVPVFCIHPAVGVAWNYAALATEVDGPLYGVQVPGLDGSERLPRSVEEYAARYEREIRALHDGGPCVVLGWSLGGVIAHALATRLQKEGSNVTLVLVDARMTAPENADSFSVADLGRRLGVEGHSFEAISKNFRAQYPAAISVTGEHMRRMYEPVVEAPSLVAAYAPRVFSGDTIYVSARGSDGASGWRDFVDRPLRVRHVDAEHDEMLGPVGARAIGEELRAATHLPVQYRRAVGGDLYP